MEADSIRVLYGHMGRVLLSSTNELALVSTVIGKGDLPSYPIIILRSVPGIGPVSATILCAEMPEDEDFRRQVNLYPVDWTHRFRAITACQQLASPVWSSCVQGRMKMSPDTSPGLDP